MNTTTPEWSTGAAPRTTADGMWARALRAIPGGVNSATRFIGPPYAWSHAAGAYIYDADGRRYIDYHAAFGATLLGHADERVTTAVTEAIREHDLIGLGVTELEIQCAELLNETIPSAEQTILTMSGSESTFQAVRLARGATGRDLIIKFQGCFHGWHDSVARNVISTVDSAYGMDPISSGILPPALEATLIAEFNDLSSVEHLFADHPDRIAAIILEPIPHNVGCILPDQEFLEGLRQMCTKHGSVLIFDEVITGFRHAPGGYQQLCGVTPDLTTFGKAMGNGHPVAGMSGSQSLMSQFSSAGGPVLLAGTFNGGAVSTAAAIATVTAVNDPGFHSRLFAKGDRMRSGLAGIVEKLGITAHVTGFGSVFILYFCDGPVRGYRDLLDHNDLAYAEFHRRMTGRGFAMLPMSLKRNHISDAHTDEHIDLTIEAAEIVIGELVMEGIAT